MTRPNPRRPQTALSAAFSNAIDLSALKRPAAAPAAPGAAPGQPRSPFVVDVDEASFATNVVEVSGKILVLVNLWSPRSAPSLQLSQLLEKLVIEQNGAVLLANVDVDVNPRIAQAFQVQSIPAVAAVAEGQPVDAFTGLQDEAQLRPWLASLVDALRERLPGIAAAGAPVEPEPEPEDERFTAAENHIVDGDFPAAIAAYEAILAVEPANADAVAALGQVKFHARVSALPQDTIQLAEADPDSVQLQLGAADMEMALGDPQAAFDRLIAAVRRTAGDDKVAVRTHLIELFALVGSDDELVIKARRQLAAALY